MGNFGNIEEAKKEYKMGGGEWYNFKVGENKIRIVSLFNHFGEHWDNTEKKSVLCIGKDSGCEYCKAGDRVSPKWLGWIIDREDGEFKILKTGFQVIKQISALDESDDYGFGEDGLPKYDIVVKREGEKLKTKYTVIPGRQDVELTEEELKKQKELKDPLEIIVAMKDKLNNEPDDSEILDEETPI